MKVETIAALDFAAHAMRQSRPDAGAASNESASERRVDAGRDGRTGSQALKIAENGEDKSSPQEILDRIKEITDDGYYSVRFEKNMEFDEIVVKIVDRNTDEVIREVPPEELMRVKARLTEFSGNIFSGVT